MPPLVSGLRLWKKGLRCKRHRDKIDTEACVVGIKNSFMHKLK